MGPCRLAFAVVVTALVSTARGYVIGDNNAVFADPGTGTQIFLDLDGDGRPDIRLFASTELYDTTSFVAAADGSDLMFTGSRLPFGSQVDASRTFSASSVSITSIHSIMNPQDNTPGGTIEGPFGFRFTSGGQTHYGWADISVTARASEFDVIYAASINGWGYESTPDAPITVGIVPEPMIAALFVLAVPAFFPHRRSPSR